MYRLILISIGVLISCFWGSGLAGQQKDYVDEKVISCHGLDKDNVTLRLDEIRGWMKIIFQNCTHNQEFDLPHNLNFSKKSNLQIKGDQIEGDQKAIINCTNSQINFENINNLSLENLHIENCGTDNKTSTFTGGVNIVNCSNVTLRRVTIELSQRTGLILVNTSGEVMIENSIFLRNGRMWKSDASTQQIPEESDMTKLEGRGGGMLVLISKGQKNTSLKILECQFSKNSAHDGGGAFLVINEEAKRINIAFLSTIFDSNSCSRGGGGLGIVFGEQTHNYGETLSNISTEIAIQNSTFSFNQAKYGGGVNILSILGPFRFSSDILTFTECVWTNNSAVLGLAVDIAIAPEARFKMHRHLPSPVFADCQFIENRDESVRDSPFIVNKPRSVLFVTGFKVVFRGNTVFEKNLGSAIEATAAILDFEANSTALFKENKAIEGGAWNLQALTTVYIHDDSHFFFEENKATHSGGAIFAQFADKHSLFLSQSCFIQHDTVPRNLTIIFRNNQAGAVTEKGPVKYLKNLRHSGDSIWVTSISPCIMKCTSSLTVEPVPISNMLQCIGDVSFDRLQTERRQISTAPSHFAYTHKTTGDSMCAIHVNVSDNTVQKNPNFNSSEVNPFTKTLHLIPGKFTTVPLQLVDDLCAETFFLARVRIISSDKYMYVHPAHSVITDNRITLYGDENQSGSIQLTTLEIRAITVTINVFIESCPPGFIHDNTTKACNCSANQDTTNYPGIERCNLSVAYIQHGYWVGYLDDTGNTRENSLATSMCPKGFCSNSTKAMKEHPLPSNADENISFYICNVNRIGRVCGQCRENRSAYYHSMSFLCRSNDLCHLGWMFYILSELVPVTLLFLIVIAFNISFTSGPLNGVIFFMQIVDTLKIKGENFIWFNESVYNFTLMYKLVYRIFSLNFFSIEHLSFCLWSGASALDLLAFRYVTIVYSLLLIIGTVLLLKVCRFKFCNKYSISLKGSVIHGLSAFLVLSYSECARVSIMIWTRGTFTIGPSENRLENRYFAFYNGEYVYMGPEHLKYALPAIFFLISMVSIPPLILFSYPLCYKLFALLRIEESKFVHITCKILPLEKIKPLFDSIQSAFKDRYRFFSGLYFIYRLSSLATFSITYTMSQHYTITRFLLVCMLVLHTICRPYKKSWQNVLDACLFFNLFLINELAYCNYQLGFSKIDQESTINHLAAFQAVLILLPLVYLTVYTSHWLVQKLKSRCGDKQSVLRQRESNDIDDGQLLHAIDSRDVEESVEERSHYYLLESEQDRGNKEVVSEDV